MEFNTHYLFAAAGNIIPMNAWVPENVIDQIEEYNADPSKVQYYRKGNEYDYAGEKTGVQYNFVPEDWGIPDHVDTLSTLMYNKGSHLYPHRDKWRGLKEDGTVKRDGFRMICHINKTDPKEFCFVVDDKIFKPEPRRWYIVNTQLVHYGFSFEDDVYHLTCGMTLTGPDRQKSIEWIMDNLPYAQDTLDNKGVICTRN